MLVASGVKRTADEDGDAESKRPRVAEHCALSTEEILSKVEERENARKCKDFATSDQLRDALRDMGGLYAIENVSGGANPGGREAG